MEDLTQFFKNKKASHDKEQLKWNNIRAEWVQQLREFMRHIKSWLEEFQQDGLITIYEKEMEIDEENIGKYLVPALELYIGKECIKITPVGRLIIGARGRVDISSFLNRYIILYHSEKGWIYRKEGNQGNFQPFTKDNFTKIIKELV